jgi:hypothetical protein
MCCLSVCLSVYGLPACLSICRLKCYERRKCVNAIVTSDLRQLSARMSGSGPGSGSSGGYSGGTTPCLLCLVPFSMFRRQHHCRLCDALCCDECSRKRVLVDKIPVGTYLIDIETVYFLIHNPCCAISLYCIVCCVVSSKFNSFPLNRCACVTPAIASPSSELTLS